MGEVLVGHRNFPAVEGRYKAADGQRDHQDLKAKRESKAKRP